MQLAGTNYILVVIVSQNCAKDRKGRNGLAPFAVLGVLCDTKICFCKI